MSKEITPVQFDVIMDRIFDPLQVKNPAKQHDYLGTKRLGPDEKSLASIDHWWWEFRGAKYELKVELFTVTDDRGHPSCESRFTISKNSNPVAWTEGKDYQFPQTRAIMTFLTDAVDQHEREAKRDAIAEEVDDIIGELLP